MKKSFYLWSGVLPGLYLVYLLAPNQTTDFNTAGSPASVDVLSQIGGLTGNGKGCVVTTTNCTANVPCALAAGGGCAMPGAAYTAGVTKGPFFDQFCTGTGLNCTQNTLNGCVASYLVCQALPSGGCGCIGTVATPTGLGVQNVC